MKLTFPLTALVCCLAIAGCEQTSTTSENKPVADNRSATPPRTSTDVAQPKAVWSTHGKSADSAQVESNQPSNRFEEEEEPPPEKDPPIAESWKALNKEKTIFFEETKEGKRRIHLLAKVCLRDGQLEVLLCKTSTKEHESILHIDLDAREIHSALLVARAKPGSTVKFVPKYVPATGDPIKVTLTYYKDGKLESNKPAQSWIQHIKTKKDLEHDWVFAGSREFKFPVEPGETPRPPYYCANNGEVISIANFSDSMLDLPVMSSKEAAELGYVANKEKIPPLKTKVIVTLEVLKKG